MYTVMKRMEISAAHHLCLPYDSKCTDTHGHNWIVEVTCVAEELNSSGMVIDFKHIKERVHDKLDHGVVNSFVEQPTAENMAKWIADELGSMCVKVMVQESEGNTAWYTR